MAAVHLSYEDSIKAAYKGLGLLAFITLVEVGVSLGANAIVGNEGNFLIKLVAGLLLVGLGGYKAWFIIQDFMHMKYEMKGLMLTVLLPTLLLVWAIIAFLQEAGSWGARRNQIGDFNARPGVAASPVATPDTAAAKVDTTAKAKVDTTKKVAVTKTELKAKEALTKFEKNA